MKNNAEIINTIIFNDVNLQPFINRNLENYQELDGRIINNIPVLYGDNCKAILPELHDLVFDSRKTHKWGHFHESSLYGDQQFELGETNLYIDTRIKNWYVMWEVTKVDFKYLPGMDKEAKIFAWTPKVIKDSVLRAGYRLFWARVLVEKMVSKGEFYSSNDLDFEDPWNMWYNSENDASVSCFHVFASVSRTDYKNSEEFDKYFEKAPAFLKTHMQSRKIILSK